ncbi:hypothetical protein N7495_004406 [Penicillium taxi]|uniref:uncharacterized protein n=1 Tax=Penicillium taxi TaxID=168475 RepID=UPI002544EA43|nr:uncharacterized protein N7495_004406 [Penicillium taxi]KAJ5899662.1 hypothetical protein N7495_004406 [Penicillium taxi]
MQLVKDLKDITVGKSAVTTGSVFGGASVYVDDVALMHVKALNCRVPLSNSGYEAGTVWQDATTIVAESFPKAVAKGLLPNDGLQPTKEFRIDAKTTEEVM